MAPKQFEYTAAPPVVQPSVILPITDELVERCAKAGYKADRYYWVPRTTNGEPLLMIDPWERLHGRSQEAFKAIARAVLETASATGGAR